MANTFRYIIYYLQTHGYIDLSFLGGLFFIALIVAFIVAIIAKIGYDMDFGEVFIGTARTIILIVLILFGILFIYFLFN